MTMLPMALPEPAPREMPAYLGTAAPVEFSDGFFDVEAPPLHQAFRWMTDRGRITFAAAPINRYLELTVLSEFNDVSQGLIVNGGAATLALTPGMGSVSVEIPAGASDVHLSVNKVFPAELHPGDSRVLSIQVQSANLHSDAARHGYVMRQHANGVSNIAEMLAGKAELTSTPRSLGIDLYGACNVKPPCVYCEWDWNKKLEGDFVDAPFGIDTLDEWGAFFENSVSLVNCSIGEPFMMKNIDELLDAFGNAGKVLEMTSNGQILTDRNIQKLLGRPIDLYVSLDAATSETYEKLRNNRFTALVANLRRLIDAKGGPGHLPRVFLVFMPMKANVHELDDFIRLCKDLRADQLVLRPLNYSDNMHMNWERAGYSFDYQKELLPFDRLVWISGRAAELCRRLGVELSDQMNFGGDMGAAFQQQFEAGRRSVTAEFDGQPVASADARASEAIGAPSTAPAPASIPTPPKAPAPTEAALPSLGGEHQPACTEPWKSLYILRRGVFPCCYGGEPVAPMDHYREAWNSPLIQDIRRDLARGRFHRYCLDSPACPIVRKVDHAGDVPFWNRERLRIRAHRWLGWVEYAAQWSALRARRIVTEPAYVRLHVGKIWRAIVRR